MRVLVLMLLALGTSAAGAEAAPPGVSLYEHRAMSASATVVTFTAINRSTEAISEIRVCARVPRTVAASGTSCRAVGILLGGEAFTFAIRLPAHAAPGRDWAAAGAVKTFAIRV